METEKTKCLIVGSGPAGYTAAIYVSRAGFTPILYEGMAPGGQLTTTTRIENFPGFPDGIDGGVLMENMKQQAIRYGADIRMGAVTGVDFTMRPFRVTVNGEKRIEAEALIIATGAEARYLGLESEQRFRGMGVSACATCDGFFYRGQDVVVVGGGDSACEEAAYLATICRKVYMIVRKDRFRASKAMQERVMTTPNIEIRFETTTQEVLGDDSGVTGVRVRRADGREEELGVTGFFVAIGHQPNTEIFRGSLELDDEGYIKTAPGSCRTNIVGVFAAGDVITGTKFVIDAIASARECAQLMDKYLGGDGDIDQVLVDRTLNPEIGTIENFATLPREELGVRGAEERKKDFAPIFTGFTCQQGQCEASRCLQCDLRVSIQKVENFNAYSNR